MKLKPFYKVRGVEYSTDFKFFLEHQIVIVTNVVTMKFFSRLNGQLFKTLPTINSLAIEQKINKKATCKEIHKNLLTGKYGLGEFID